MDVSHLLEQESVSSVGDENPLSLLALEMQQLKEQLERLEEQRKPLQARYDEVRKHELPDAMAAANVTGFKLASGGSVYIKMDVYVSCPKPLSANLVQWFYDHDARGLVSEVVHPKTLTAWYQEQVDEGNVVPDFLSVFRDPLAVLRK